MKILKTKEKQTFIEKKNQLISPGIRVWNQKRKENNRRNNQYLNA